MIPWFARTDGLIHRRSASFNSSHFVPTSATFGHDYCDQPGGPVVARMTNDGSEGTRTRAPSGSVSLRRARDAAVFPRLRLWTSTVVSAVPGKRPTELLS